MAKASSKGLPGICFWIRIEVSRSAAFRSNFIKAGHLFAGSKKQAGVLRTPFRPPVVAILLLALLSLFFLLQVVPHEHADGHDDPACRLCQVAHVGITPAVLVVLLSLVLVTFGSTSAPIRLRTIEPFFGRFSSRAPPAGLV